MKKIFTLSVLMLLTLSVSAQETYRKSWDFTKWSATTVANLVAESAKGPATGAWSDVEKAGDTAPTDISKDNCYWEVTPQGTAEGATLMANGEPIAETQGLLFTHTNKRNLAIALNYPSTSLGNYAGGAYLWLGGANYNYFVIPHVAPGTTIKMGVESHKSTDARGVDLFIGWGNGGTKLLSPDGIEVAKPTVYADQEWLVPEDATDTPNDDGTFDITVRNSNGCHIYYITVGDGDEPQVEEAKKVGYIFEGDIDSDYPYIFLSGSDKFDVTPVDPSISGLTVADLQQFDVIVISPMLSESLSAARVLLNGAIAYVPVVNLNARSYDVLALGKAVETATSTLTVAAPGNDIFEGLGETVEYDGPITAVELGDYFAADEVLAKAGDAVAIHAHNPGRNAYYFVPAENMSEDVYLTLIPQTVLAAARTKRDVTAVGTPVITVSQDDGESTVTITAANAKAIYYTTDGTEPTIASSLYGGPFTLTAQATVKAFATGDGYYDSQVSEKLVTIAVKAATPTFTLVREQGQTLVALECATAGVDVYYNFAGQSAAAASVKYTEPFIVSTPATVTAFAAAAEGILASDLAQQFVGIDGIDKTNIRWDVAAHFDANADDWSGKGEQTDADGNIVNANYFFTWGKNQGLYYTDEVDHEETYQDQEGNDSIVVVYKSFEPSVFTNGSWNLKSVGQVLTWEKLNLGWNIADGSMRNPDTAEDAIGVNDEMGITENAITFGKQPSDGPFNASLETVEKMAGPFDVVVYAGNGNDGETPTMQIETSADGQQWEKLGDVNFSLIKRVWKKTVLSYEGQDQVFVRLLHTAAKSGAQIYDIYVMTNGERSQQYDESGIRELLPEGDVVRTEVFLLNGMRAARTQAGTLKIVRKTYANGAVVTQKTF